MFHIISNSAVVLYTEVKLFSIFALSIFNFFCISDTKYRRGMAGNCTGFPSEVAVPQLSWCLRWEAH